MDDPADERGENVRRPTDCLIVATTDPAIAAEADHRADWKRHPFATIRLETTQVGGPVLMPLSSPWAIDPPAPTTLPDPCEPATPASAEPRPDEPPPTRAVIRMIRRAPSAWWPAVAAGLIGGLIGSLGYRAIFESRRPRDGHAIR